MRVTYWEVKNSFNEYEASILKFEVWIWFKSPNWAIITHLIAFLKWGC